MTRLQQLRDRRGLTLIELVLTLTILAIAGALIAGSLSGGLRAWDSGLRSGREELVARIVLERVAAQLRAAVASPAKRGEEELIAFDAGEDHLRFVTPAAAGSAPVQVYYGLDGSGDERCLVFREYPWPDKDFFAAGRPRREERLPEVTGFAVKVRKRSAEEDPSGGVTQDAEWNPMDKELPGLVTIELSLRPAGRSAPRSYRVAVPVLARSVP